MRLFQIEEPGGGPTDPNGPGAAIAIEATGARAEVAFSVGGNALILDERPGFEQALPVPAAGAGAAAWQELLEGARIRAERALARPVTHAIVVLALAPDAAMTGHLRQYFGSVSYLASPKRRCFSLSTRSPSGVLRTLPIRGSTG